MQKIFTALEFCDLFRGFNNEESTYLEDASSEIPLDTYMEAKDKLTKAIQQSEIKEKNLLAKVWQELKSIIEKLIDAIKNKNHTVNIKLDKNAMMKVSGKEVQKHSLLRGLFKVFGKVIGNPLTFPFKVAALILGIKAVLAGKKIYGEMKETQQKVSEFVTMPWKKVEEMRKEKEKWLDVIKSGVSKLGLNPGKLDELLHGKKEQKKGESRENASEKSLAASLQSLGNAVAKSVENLDKTKPIHSPENHSKEELKAVNKKLEKKGANHRYVPAKDGNGTYKVTNQEYEDIKSTKEIKKKVNVSVEETKQIQKEKDRKREEKEKREKHEKKEATGAKDRSVKEERKEGGKKQYGSIRSKDGRKVNLDTILARNARLADEEKKERWILDENLVPTKTMSASSYKSFGERLKSGYYKAFQASADLSDSDLVGDSYLESDGNWWD